MKVKHLLAKEAKARQAAEDARVTARQVAEAAELAPAIAIFQARQDAGAALVAEAEKYLDDSGSFTMPLELTRAERSKLNKQENARKKWLNYGLLPGDRGG